MKKTYLPPEVANYIDTFSYASGTALFSVLMDDSFTLLYGNDAYYAIHEYTKESMSEWINNKCSGYVHPEDLSKVKEICSSAAANADGKVVVEWDMRVRTGKGNVRQVHVRGVISEWGGRSVMNGSVKDITADNESSRLQQTVKYVCDRQDQLDLYRTINNGGVFILSAEGDWELLYANDKYYEFHGYTPESMKRIHDNKVKNYVYAEDLPAVEKSISEGIASGLKRFDTEMRVVCGDGTVKHIMVRSEFVNIDGIRAISGMVIDITKQKEAEEKARINQEIVRIAVEQAGVTFWIYEMAEKRIYQSEENRTFYGYELVTENVPDCFWGDGSIYPEDEAEVRRMYQELLSGSDSAQCEVRWKDSANGLYQWRKIIYTAVYGKHGKTTRAVGTGIDISEQKMLEVRYNEGLSYREVVKGNTVGSFRFNLTTNRCSDGYSKDCNILALQDGGTVDSFFAAAYANIPGETQRKLYADYYNRSALINKYYEGTLQCSHEHPYLFQNKCIWLMTSVTLFKNPASGDIEAFIYATDINERKSKEEIFNSVISSDYDYILRIDAERDLYQMYTKSDKQDQLPAQSGDSYIAEVRSCIRRYVCEEDRERALQKLELSNIITELKSKDLYDITLKVKGKDGDVLHKKIRYSYLDREMNVLLMTRIDVTHIFKEEQRKNELLASALEAAKQASSAKTDFLSRMSHEIRTPMNAIIGMSAIAAKSIGNNDNVSDCISKIGISSRFLLSLINDILDMSRIESGKVLLKNEKISFNEFLNAIIGIIYSQAEAQEVEFESIIDASVDDCYIGDAMKLQQVIINILGNAVKFTPPNGKVTFSVRQKQKKGNSVILEFVISDTGCGISDEFLPRLFEPFSQEHSCSTTMYGGTGLGLAISKNLVSMMDGDIRVRSIVGIGSEFDVTVKLGVSEEARLRSVNKQTGRFADLFTLVVDDDVDVCRNAAEILHEMGIKAEWVDSGCKAVELVAEKWRSKQFYNIILLDWKMPEMDGIEAARRIRAIVGLDVTIIIMTAYNWSAIEHEAKLAGVNMLMDKPLFRSSLISAFEHVMGEKQEDDRFETVKQYDFSGRRVLLCEDHPLNIEVAKKLLETRGFIVDVAENGGKGVETFTLSQPGYYDAVLMDIRMPVMDGLQAAILIRRLSRPDAKTVPIIAMTANAFEDDIERSQRAGMNAHLAKPIDPDLLYRTLYEYLTERESLLLPKHTENGEFGGVKKSD